jgi:hypothetical protein
MNQLIAIEARLPSVPGTIKGENLAIADKVGQELQAWSGYTEHDIAVRSRLEEYWNPYWWDNDPDVPWSAVFISYLLANENFKGSPQHLQYVKNVINGESPGWKAFSIPKNQQRIQLNIGDVLIRPRSGSDTATHGDIVYQIRNGKAYLVGGNVSNTAKIVGTLDVSSSGILKQDVSGYLVVLKKKAQLGKVILPLLIGAGAVAAVLLRKK